MTDLSVRTSHPKLILIDSIPDPIQNRMPQALPGYIKLSNVSKQVPDDAYVQLFIKTVDEHWARALPSAASPSYIAVHCHYGFNRTGFMLCCYMVERCRYPVQKAIDTVCLAEGRGFPVYCFLYVNYVHCIMFVLYL